MADTTTQQINEPNAQVNEAPAAPETLDAIASLIASLTSSKDIAYVLTEKDEQKRKDAADKLNTKDTMMVIDILADQDAFEAVAKKLGENDAKMLQHRLVYSLEAYLRTQRTVVSTRKNAHDEGWSLDAGTSGGGTFGLNASVTNIEYKDGKKKTASFGIEAGIICNVIETLPLTKHQEEQRKELFASLGLT